MAAAVLALVLWGAAAGAVTISIPDLEACPGVCIEIPLSVDETDDLAAMDATLVFDPAVLTVDQGCGSLCSALPPGWAALCSEPAAGRVRVYAYDPAVCATPLSSPDLAVIRLRVSEGLACGDYQLCIAQGATLSDCLGGAVPAAVTCATLSVDCEPPVISCPADVSAISPDGLPVAVDIGQATASDNCEVVSLTCDAPAEFEFPLGTTIVTWTACDGAGNCSSCSQTVTVTHEDCSCQPAGDRVCLYGPGWNLVAQPRAGSHALASCQVQNVATCEVLSFGEAADAGWVDSQLWRWDAIARTYVVCTCNPLPGEESTLGWGHGYWLYTELDEATLILPLQ